MSADFNQQRAWVVFSGQTDLWWVRLLKVGFRHCYVILHDGKHWLSLDPLASHMELAAHDLPSGFDLPQWLAEQGHRIVPTKIQPRHKCPAPCSIMSCVEIVKRVLGIRKRTILTPWQLYRHLTQNKPYKLGGIKWEV